jgi:hypothetical protein
MGVIIKNLPSITDVDNIVTIDTNNTIILSSPLINITDSAQTTFNGLYVNVAPSTLNIGNNGGTLIFYGDNVKPPITQPAAIPDASVIDVVTTLNTLLQVMRDFNLIAT